MWNKTSTLNTKPILTHNLSPINRSAKEKFILKREKEYKIGGIGKYV